MMATRTTTSAPPEAEAAKLAPVATDVPRSAATSSARRSLSGLEVGITIALVIQALCAVFFLYRIASDVFGFGAEPISWFAHELIEIGAAVGLLLGTILGAVAVSRILTRTKAAEDQLETLSHDFHVALVARFDTWKLTPAERDVAYFVAKGFSSAEIAGLRNTSEGTVKAQTVSIFRKAGVSSRMQLVNLFFEDILSESLAAARPDQIS